jgi:hypothetical protein
MKTKFVAVVISAMFPLGVLAQNAGVGAGGGPRRRPGCQGFREQQSGSVGSGTGVGVGTTLKGCDTDRRSAPAQRAVVSSSGRRERQRAIRFKRPPARTPDGSMTGSVTGRSGERLRDRQRHHEKIRLVLGKDRDDTRERVCLVAIWPIGVLAADTASVLTLISARVARDAGWFCTKRRHGRRRVSQQATRHRIARESRLAGPSDYRYGQREPAPEELPMKGRAPMPVPASGSR